MRGFQHLSLVGIHKMDVKKLIDEFARYTFGGDSPTWLSSTIIWLILTGLVLVMFSFLLTSARNLWLEIIQPIFYKRIQRINNLEMPSGDVRLKENVKVFLCHSSNDKPKIMQLYNRLKLEKGMDVWIDVEKLLPGVEWDLEIRTAVRDSHIVLVCLSKNSINKEGYIQKEIRQALDVADEKPEGALFIIPLRLEECEVPDRLKKWQWLNFYEDDSYDKLLSSLRKRENDLAAKNTGAQ